MWNSFNYQILLLLLLVVFPPVFSLTVSPFSGFLTCFSVQSHVSVAFLSVSTSLRSCRIPAKIVFSKKEKSLLSEVMVGGRRVLFVDRSSHVNHEIRTDFRLVHLRDEQLGVLNHDVFHQVLKIVTYCLFYENYVQIFFH